MKVSRVLAVFFVLICLVGCVTASAEETKPTVPENKDMIPTEVAGHVPQTVKTLLKQHVFIAPTERLTLFDVQTVMDACEDVLMRSVSGRIDIPTDVKNTYRMLRECEEAVCTPTYLYTFSKNENGLTTEYMYYVNGDTVKAVGYELNGIRYSAFNNDNSAIMMQGAPSGDAAKREVNAINVSDVLFGFVIAVVLVMIVAAVVMTVKKKG